LRQLAETGRAERINATLSIPGLIVSPTDRAGLDPGFVISSRYRIDGPLEGEFSSAAYAGRDTEGEKPVWVLEVSAKAAKALVRGKGVEHAHLAHVLDVVEVEGRHWLVCEQIMGQTLEDLLAMIGKKPPVDAVRSALRISDALSTLHEAGSAHGLVHPRNTILAPEGRAAPVLVFGPLATLETQYRQPEWEAGDPPSEPDDSWGAAALFHTMLLGEPPPREGYLDHGVLAEIGVTDPVLRAALFHALAHDVGKRGHDLKPFKRELARWFVEHAGEELMPNSTRHHSTSPPPLPQELVGSQGLRPGSARPASMRPGSTRRSSMPASLLTGPIKTPSKLPVLASAAIIVGLVGAWFFSWLGPRRHPPVKAPPPVAAAPSATAIELSEVPVTGQETQTVSTDKMGSCVAGYLPKGTFVKVPDMSWVCDETDPRLGAEKLRVAVVNGAKGATTDAMKIFARIGWYDMAAFSVVRAGCCENAKPLALAAPSGTCPPIPDALREVGSAVVGGRHYDEQLKKYMTAIQCEVEAGHGTSLRHAARPAPGEDIAFGDWVRAFQQ
jgi:serine/threonine protein kinase